MNWRFYLFLIYLVSICVWNDAKAEDGTWVRTDGTVAHVPCPTHDVQADETLTLRLPAGCPVLHPRIGYTVSQDLRIRGEVTELRRLVPTLRQEVTDSRTAADKIIAEQAKVLDITRVDLDAQRARAQDAEALGAGLQTQLAEAQEDKTTAALVGGSVGVVVGVGLALVLVLVI